MWLLVASYYFYMAWNPVYALLMALSTVATFFAARLISCAPSFWSLEGQRFWKKFWLVFCLALNLGILFLFKYFNFGVNNLNFVLRAAGISIVLPNSSLLLPVGISFYTFQALGYTVDVYRGDMAAQRNLARYALFVSFFPQLVAGPIERSANLLPQINAKHHFCYENAKDGLLLMMWGYFQKLVVADRLALAVDKIFGSYADFSGWGLLFATFLFAFQIYGDFSGYTDIARGAAKVMGFELTENFRQPYFAFSVSDFWRRWHISLSTWFRDYMYIPLGGSRGGQLKKYRNVFLVFLTSGLWHGAHWTFVVWGMLHGVFQIIGDIIRPFKYRLYKYSRLRLPCGALKVAQGIVTFILIDFAWLFFRAPTLGAALDIIKRIVTAAPMTEAGAEVLPQMGPLYCIGLILPVVALLLLDAAQTRYSLLELLNRQKGPVRWICYYALFFAVAIFGVVLAGSASTEFIYFQF